MFLLCFSCLNFSHILICYYRKEKRKKVILRGRRLFLTVPIFRKKSIFCDFSRNCHFRHQLESWTGTWDCLEKIISLFYKNIISLFDWLYWHIILLLIAVKKWWLKRICVSYLYISMMYLLPPTYLSCDLLVLLILHCSVCLV